MSHTLAGPLQRCRHPQRSDLRLCIRAGLRSCGLAAWDSHMAFKRIRFHPSAPTGGVRASLAHGEAGPHSLFDLAARSIAKASARELDESLGLHRDVLGHSIVPTPPSSQHPTQGHPANQLRLRSSIILPSPAARIPGHRGWHPRCGGSDAPRHPEPPLQPQHVCRHLPPPGEPAKPTPCARSIYRAPANPCKRGRSACPRSMRGWP